MNNLPIELRLEFSKEKIVDSINKIANEYSLSYYLLSIIIEEIYRNVEEAKINEIKEIKKAGEENNDISKDNVGE